MLRSTGHVERRPGADACQGSISHQSDSITDFLGRRFPCHPHPTRRRPSRGSKHVTIIASRVIALALAFGCAGHAHAQVFPSKPITLVVGFAPGGPTDTVARIIADHMKTTLGQTVVVENVGGAAGTIAAARVARATPDGHTLNVGQWTSNVGGPAITPTPYDVLNDFEPVSLLTTSYLWILGRKSLPANNLQELIAWLKANPDKSSGAIVGSGSAAHVCFIDFQIKSGTRFALFPYKGGTPALQDLVGGQVDISCLEAAQTMQQFRAGMVKVFGVLANKRWAGAPDVPTLAEGGLPGHQIEFWHGLWAPKGTPKDVVAKLNAAVSAAFADPAVRKRFTDLGHAIPAQEQQSPQALFAHHKAELDRWWPLIKAAGIKAP
ncbi:MAG: tripartite tricarboxylate transporter substrate binding protein BugD [Xanthobacteraceae bacterium]|nr:tripartite tricarboxylate transporter substrate binding protein BugD [Xanthobacteraceae bacterium]